MFWATVRDSHEHFQTSFLRFGRFGRRENGSEHLYSTRSEAREAAGLQTNVVRSMGLYLRVAGYLVLGKAIGSCQGLSNTQIIRGLVDSSPFAAEASRPTEVRAKQRAELASVAVQNQVVALSQL